MKQKHVFWFVAMLIAIPAFPLYVDIVAYCCGGYVFAPLSEGRVTLAIMCAALLAFAVTSPFILDAV